MPDYPTVVSITNATVAYSDLQPRTIHRVKVRRPVVPASCKRQTVIWLKPSRVNVLQTSAAANARQRLAHHLSPRFGASVEFSCRVNGPGSGQPSATGPISLACGTFLDRTITRRHTLFYLSANDALEGQAVSRPCSSSASRRTSGSTWPTGREGHASTSHP